MHHACQQAQQELEVTRQTTALCRHIGAAKQRRKGGTSVVRSHPSAAGMAQCCLHVPEGQRSEASFTAAASQTDSMQAPCLCDSPGPSLGYVQTCPWLYTQEQPDYNHMGSQIHGIAHRQF